MSQCSTRRWGRAIFERQPPLLLHDRRCREAERRGRESITPEHVAITRRATCEASSASFHLGSVSSGKVLGCARWAVLLAHGLILAVQALANAEDGASGKARLRQRPMLLLIVLLFGVLARTSRAAEGSPSPAHLLRGSLDYQPPGFRVLTWDNSPTGGWVPAAYSEGERCAPPVDDQCLSQGFFPYLRLEHDPSVNGTVKTQATEDFCAGECGQRCVTSLSAQHSH